MTIQEAIERFEYVKANATHQKDAGVSEYWQQEIDATIEAINMAIEALQNADRKTEPSKEQNFCGKCRYLYRDFKYGLSCYRLMDNEPCKYEDRKTENCSEKPNNGEHITEDGVTCAKYPACDDCLDNPLNKVKGSERLVKGSDESQPEPSGYKTKPVEDEPQTERSE